MGTYMRPRQVDDVGNISSAAKTLSGTLGVSTFLGANTMWFYGSQLHGRTLAHFKGADRVRLH
jgi:hypothetical protein